MALNAKISNVAANAAIDAITALLNTGYLRIYDGTQPATVDTAIGAQVLLAELRFGASAFGAGSAGVATANAITSDTDNNATGTATWYRCLKSDGTTAIHDGSIDTSGANINLNSVALQIHAQTDVTTFTLTAPKA